MGAYTNELTVLSDGDVPTGTQVMKNWRNLNYGKDVLPVDVSGNAISNTLNHGSNTERWKKYWGAGLDISGTGVIDTLEITTLSSADVVEAENINGLTGTGAVDSDNIPEGSTNLYLTAGSVTQSKLSTSTGSGSGVTDGHVTLSGGTYSFQVNVGATSGSGTDYTNWAFVTQYDGALSTSLVIAFSRSGSSPSATGSYENRYITA